MLVILFLIISCPLPSWGDRLPEDLPRLTLALLQERLKSPEQISGKLVVNLRRVLIDLRPGADLEANNALNPTQFYQLLQPVLAGGKYGLDLSQSVILGEFEIQRLGLRSPLYGEALSPLFTPQELAQLNRDRRRLTQLSQLSKSLLIQPSVSNPLQITVLRTPLIFRNTKFQGKSDFSNTFFLSSVNAESAIFQAETDWIGTRFSQAVNFNDVQFLNSARFKNLISFAEIKLTHAKFYQTANFSGSVFYKTAQFNQAEFIQEGKFNRVKWLENADFSQSNWQGFADFSKATFRGALFLNESRFETGLSFRETQFNQPVNLREVELQEVANFVDASFTPKAYLNVAGLQFDPEKTRIIGNSGQIGKVFSVPSLQGNANQLKALIRNFRNLEQITDANQIEYTKAKLRLQQLQAGLVNLNINTATFSQLIKLGLSPRQAQAIATRRQQQIFANLGDVLALEAIDLASYIKIRDRAVALPPRRLGNLITDASSWLFLSLLLLLSHYGTNFWLTFGVGLIAIAYFGLIFWFIDRVRNSPTVAEVVSTSGLFSAILLTGLIAVFHFSEFPGLTLLALLILILPIPTILTAFLYLHKPLNPPLESSYLVEDGSFRQLRILIGRLPVIPRYQVFRERHLPLLTARRWNILNYFDFSLNNWFRFGFNDIRLRDREIPGSLSVIAWYQWSLGLMYMTLIFWTLSRTIPGLNLLLYFK